MTESQTPQKVAGFQPVTEEKLRDLAQHIARAFDPTRIILFGSYAYGTPSSDSDVDLLIVMDSQERPAKRSQAISKLLRDRPFPMDILVRTPQEINQRLAMGDPFIREITKQGRVLYERDAAPGMGG